MAAVAPKQRIKVVWTKTYAKCLRELMRKGKKGMDAKLKAESAQSQANMDGEIATLRPTKWGESRLPNVTKYDLGDGYRLVTQIVTVGNVTHRAFLYVGDHEDADKWLDNHRNFVWMKSESDGTLDFIEVTEGEPVPEVVPSLGVASSEQALEAPLLHDVGDALWEQSKLPKAVQDYIKRITASQWQQDPNGVLHHIEQIADTDVACLAHDILTPAHLGDMAAAVKRLEHAAGTASIVTGPELVAAMEDTANSEQFITWDDSDRLPQNMDWQDWMLFLRPAQKELSLREFNGPARVRGVSGSGKTCVMVHRARHLAKRYREPLLLVTLTESTRKLLDVLVGTLCGAERALITTSTMSSFVQDVLEAWSPRSLTAITQIVQDRQNEQIDAAFEAARSSPGFLASSLAAMNDEALKKFIEDEVFFVRTRLCPAQYDGYLDLSRRGRKVQLQADARRVILDAVRAWDASLEKRRAVDHEGITQLALQVLDEGGRQGRQPSREGDRVTFRCVLVDEVQDLSELELRILSRVCDDGGRPAVDQVDGLFLTGDGAQSIYNKSFSLKQCGIRVANRSYFLKKNYRNTRQILEAAYGLITHYEFTDTDEEDVARPVSPDFSTRQGDRPAIVKCSTFADECEFVVQTVRRIREQLAARDESKGFEQASSYPIGVIGFNPKIRDGVTAALERSGIATLQLREHVGWDSDAVKISTLESAKGHEFEAVILVGVANNVIPRPWEENRKLEASRLYVAMTRAREQLFMSYCATPDAGPSVFLSEIAPFCDEFKWNNGEMVPL